MRALLAALIMTASPALAGEWFLHEYGELRAYHSDWLAVCNDAGDGPCRIVATAKDPGSSAFFDLRLAAHRLDGSPNWAVEIMDRGLPAESISQVSLDFDGELVEVSQDAWRAGDFDGYAASDTIVVFAPEYANRIVDLMKAGNSVTIRYAPTGEGDGNARFSLRGVTAAANAIEARVLARQE